MTSNSAFLLNVRTNLCYSHSVTWCHTPRLVKTVSTKSYGSKVYRILSDVGFAPRLSGRAKVGDAPLAVITGYLNPEGG